jgi:hypothetical protein
MPLGLLLLLVTAGPSVGVERATGVLGVERRHEPPAAAACSRPLRTGLAGQRVKRESGGPPVFFHFEPQLQPGRAARARRIRQIRPATRPGTSRAPPFTAIA